MKKFLIQAIFFLLPLALIAYSTDVFISKELKKNHFYTGDEYSIWNDIFDGKVNSEIVIYGDSRAWTQINPGIISDSLHTTTYNLGIDGHNFELQYLRHSLLLKQNIKPKLIILSLDILTFEKNDELYNADQFLPYMLYNDEIKKATANYEGYKPIDYQLPLIRYYGKKEAIKNALKLFMWPTSDPILRVKGYSPKDSAWNSDFDKAKGKMEFYYVKLDTAIITLFENFLNECKTEKVKIIFVYIPEYIERRTFIKNRDEIFSVFAMFSKKYNIPFYDYSNDTISFHKKYFYNASHLNKTGAELFTSKLAQKLKSNNAHHPN